MDSLFEAGELMCHECDEGIHLFARTENNKLYLACPSCKISEPLIDFLKNYDKVEKVYIEEEVSETGWKGNCLFKRTLRKLR